MGGKNFRPHLVRVDSNLEVRGEERWGEERRGEEEEEGEENNEERQEEGRSQSNASYSFSSASSQWTHLLSNGSCGSPVVSSE